MKDRKIYLLLIILLLTAIPIVIYLTNFYSLSPISVNNNSKYYEVSFKNNDGIMKEINLIGTFKKDAAVYKNKPITIKRIIIQTSDQDRGKSRYIRKNATVKAVDYKIVNNELLITWYLNNKVISEFESETLSRFLLYDFLLAQRRLFSKKTEEEGYNSTLKDVNESLSRIPKNPFSVRIIQ